MEICGTIHDESRSEAMRLGPAAGQRREVRLLDRSSRTSGTPSRRCEHWASTARRQSPRLGTKDQEAASAPEEPYIYIYIYVYNRLKLHR